MDEATLKSFREAKRARTRRPPPRRSVRVAIWLAMVLFGVGWVAVALAAPTHGLEHVRVAVPGLGVLVWLTKWAFSTGASVD